MEISSVSQEPVLHINTMAEKIINKAAKPVSSDVAPAAPKIDHNLLDAITEKINKLIDMTTRRLDYSVHERTRQLVVKVIDKDSGTVIREIPSEKFLDLVANLEELLGMIFDTAV